MRYVEVEYKGHTLEVVWEETIRHMKMNALIEFGLPTTDCRNFKLYVKNVPGKTEYPDNIEPVYSPEDVTKYKLKYEPEKD